MPYMLKRSWTALTCNLEGTDIYLGLAAARDDLALSSLDHRCIRVFPFRDINIVSGAPEKVPLRVYALRDPMIVRVTPLASPVIEEGFVQVRLDFDLAGLVNAAQSNTEPVIDEHPVMAFLLAIGLPQEREEEFYGRVVHEFLDRSWMTIPRLLREVGCATVEDVAGGQAAPCPTPDH